jgi:hypothetical protein
MKGKLNIRFYVPLFFGFVLIGCVSLSNLLNPVHAINSNGEKVEAAWGDGQTVKIEGAEYSYKDRPTVPAAPQKPSEPRKPNPPSWSSGQLDVETSVNNDRRHTVESFSSREEAKRKIDFYSSQGQRNDLSALDRSHALRIAVSISDAFDFYEAQQKQYASQLAQYQANLPKYQQDVVKYNRDLAEYQAKLPEYTAAVESEVKAIQGSINSSAPGNWERYVEGKYLLYKGK